MPMRTRSAAFARKLLVFILTRVVCHMNFDGVAYLAAPHNSCGQRLANNHQESLL
ncbi:hypothetical protein AB0756_04245 [Tolypothrix campylonemoides VB511288_2]|uniref:Transposase n=2 Tax=Nostocales TaxID=1161 RepID=A0ABW8WEU7_9CYAN